MFSDGYPESLEVNVAGAVGVRPTWHADSRNTFVGLSGRAVTAISVQPPLALSNVTVRSGTRRTAVTRCANHTMSAPLCPRGTEECIIGRRRQRPRLCRSGRVGTLRTSARNLREEARHRSPAVPGSAGYSAFGPGPGDGGAAAAASGRGGTDPKERIVSQPLTRRGGLVWGGGSRRSHPARDRVRDARRRGRSSTDRGDGIRHRSAGRIGRRQQVRRQGWAHQ